LTSNYLIRRYPQIVRSEHTTLHDLAWGNARIQMCEAGTIFLTRTKDRERRKSLAARLPLLLSEDQFSLYGPCGAGSFPPVSGGMGGGKVSSRASGGSH